MKLLLGRPKFRGHRRNFDQPYYSSNGKGYEILAEGMFRRMLCLERRRAERSRRFFLLMLLDAGKLFQAAQGDETVLQNVLCALSSSTRETDIRGWYRENSVLGVIFTEINEADRASILHLMRAKVTTAVTANLDAERVDQIQVSFHFFPDWDKQDPRFSADAKLYPDLFQQEDRKRLSRFFKRTVDIVGTLAALALLSPLFLLISLVIKLTSKGPILFKQERLGQYGVPFTFLKFRSMEHINDPRIHKEYVQRFISGQVHSADGNHSSVYKLQGDPRVTPSGKFLRKTSLDELPQLFNVLKGEMSLVGPRPPILYELEAYDIWHRRRLLEAKPGITGLWQVNGRSRLKFDDMVRLDLRYAENWSLWLDAKILLQTPRAVLSGEGAY